MKNPFRRTPARDPQVENALRHSLAEHARHAPAGDELTDRIVAAVDDAHPAPAFGRRSPTRWRTWALPLVAAGSVAAIVGVVAGIQQLDQPSSRGSAIDTQPAPQPTASIPTVPIPTTTAPSVHTSRSSGPIDTSTLHGVQILDLTFVDVDDGWALATADCIRGTGRCAALLRTHDGRKWTSSPRIGFNVVGQTAACTVPCVQHIRFATDRIGYAFGPNTLMMTTDGGRHWGEQSGGALFLETLNQNVIRVTSPHSGCPGPCDIRVQTAALGSSSWTTELGPLNTPKGVEFARGGDDAYLLLTGHTSGGSGTAESLLFRSSDNGVTWKPNGEPCPPTRTDEVDATFLAAGAAGRVAALCVPRDGSFHTSVVTSVDHGAHFTSQRGAVPAGAAGQLTGDPATVLLTARDGIARSVDGGRSWATVPYAIDEPVLIGFENPQVGRILAAGGREIWTTRDAGKTWTKVLFR